MRQPTIPVPFVKVCTIFRDDWQIYVKAMIEVRAAHETCMKERKTAIWTILFRNKCLSSTWYIPTSGMAVVSRYFARTTYNIDLVGFPTESIFSGIFCGKSVRRVSCFGSKSRRVRRCAMPASSAGFFRVQRRKQEAGVSSPIDQEE